MGWRWWYRFLRLYGNSPVQSALKVAAYELRLTRHMYIYTVRWF